MATKKQFTIGDMIYDDKTKELIKLMVEESVTAWAEWSGVPRDYCYNHPLIKYAGENQELRYKGIYYDEKVVGFFGRMITSPIPVLNIEEFYIEEVYQTPTKMKEVLALIKDLASEEECVKVRFDIFHTTKRASLMTKLKMKPFVVTYGLEV